MKNKKGFTLLEVMFAVGMLGILVSMTTSFDYYLAKHEAKVVTYETFYSHIDTELTELYKDGWDYNQKTIPTSTGDLKVTLVDLGTSEYGTSLARVTFEGRDFEQEFEVERSEYNAN